MRTKNQFDAYKVRKILLVLIDNVLMEYFELAIQFLIEKHFLVFLVFSTSKKRFFKSAKNSFKINISTFSFAVPHSRFTQSPSNFISKR